jgi:hypothetical protein
VVTTHLGNDVRALQGGNKRHSVKFGCAKVGKARQSIR